MGDYVLKQNVIMLLIYFVAFVIVYAATNR